MTLESDKMSDATLEGKGSCLAVAFQLPLFSGLFVGHTQRCWDYPDSNLGSFQVVPGELGSGPVFC